MERILIAYHSFSGATRDMANKITEQTGGDLRELIPEKPYSFDYNTASKEARSEIARGYCPVLLSGNEPIIEYSCIFVGTPNWFGSFAPPVLSFLRTHDFSGKTVIPFCTHGGGGIGEIERRITDECQNSIILPGLATYGSVVAKEIKSWLESLRLL